jgi:hypothetical protein
LDAAAIALASSCIQSQYRSPNLEAKAIVRLWSRPLRSSNVIHPPPFAALNAQDDSL